MLLVWPTVKSCQSVLAIFSGMSNRTAQQKRRRTGVASRGTQPSPVVPARTQAIVRRFSERLRPWIAGVLAADSTGKLGHLAEACPGVLIFAYALLSHERARTATAGYLLLRDAIVGFPVDELLVAALERWADGAQHLVAGWRRAGYPGRGIWHGVSEANGPARKRLLRAQSLLICHAGAQVDEHSLWLPPPMAFSVEDIPTNPRDNASWFIVVKLHSSMAVVDGLVSARARGLAAFVSRNALVVERSSMGSERRWQHRALLDYAKVTGDYPCRSTLASRYLDSAEAWHRGLAKTVSVNQRKMPT